MKKFVGVILAAILSVTAVHAQYVAQSRFLQKPDTMINFIKNCADIWKNAKDNGIGNGGYFCYIDNQGNPLIDGALSQHPGTGWYWGWLCEDFGWVCGWGHCPNLYYCPDFTGNYEFTCFSGYTPKSVVGNSRVAYAFIRAFMVTGEEDYLARARAALDWMYANGWNQQTGGWWFSTDEFGNPKPYLPSCWFNPNLWKWAYAQVYPAVGIAAMTEVTNGKKNWAPFKGQAGSTDRDWLEKAVKMVDQNLYDTRKGFEGYYTDADYSWGNKRGKGFTPTIDGITTSGAATTLIMKEPYYRNRFIDMADQAVKHLVGSMDDPRVKVGFASTYNKDWQIDVSATETEIGHVLKTAWCLGRAYMITSKSTYRASGQRLIKDVLANGYDNVNGGPYMNYDWALGKRILVKKDNTDVSGKDQWMCEQAINAGLLHRYLATSQADKDAFLKMADQTISFYMAHLVDWVNGGVWEAVSEDGSTFKNTSKGDIFEQGMHSTELGYITYLYASLLYKKQPATLYYMFEAADKNQTIQLNPIEVKDGLKITSVLRDGWTFTSYDAATRTLNIPAGVGGKFKVTFAMR